MAARTTKTAGTAESSTGVVEYDFDNWTQDAEDDALRALSDVKYIIVEQSFVGRFADGMIVNVPLQLTMGTLDELESKFATPLDQFKHLLTTFMGADVVTDLGRQNLIPVGVMVEKYFRCLQRAQELAFPES